MPNKSNVVHLPASKKRLKRQNRNQTEEYTPPVSLLDGCRKFILDEIRNEIIPEIQENWEIFAAISLVAFICVGIWVLYLFFPMP